MAKRTMKATDPKTLEWAVQISPTGVRCKVCSCVYTEPYEFWTSRGTKMVGGIPAACAVCKRDRAEARRKALVMDIDLVEAVKEHAEHNYSVGGWDYVVETYTNEQIWEVIAGAKSPDDAVRKMRKVAELLDERRREVDSTAW